MENSKDHKAAAEPPLDCRVRQPVAILAGNRAQFLEWQRKNQEVRAVFCDQWPMFAGLEFSSMVEVGTFGLRPDALEIWQRVAPMVRPNK